MLTDTISTGALGDVFYVFPVDCDVVSSFPMKTSRHPHHVQSVLEKYHFGPIDRGTAIEATPLKRHQLGLENLAGDVANQLDLTREQAAIVLKDAAAEVVETAP